MRIETSRLIITEFDLSMAESVHQNSLDEDNRRFVPDDTNIGYVQLVPMGENFEVGYHIAKEYTGNGYATEALTAFLSYMKIKMQLDKIYGICVSENIASKRVLEKSSFTKVYEGLGKYQGQERTIVKYVL